MATITLTYHARPPDGGADHLLVMSTTVVSALETIDLAAVAIARQYPYALPERASNSAWQIVDPSSRQILATLVVTT